MRPTYNQLHRLHKDDHDRRHGQTPKRHHTVLVQEVTGRLDEGAVQQAWLAVQQDYPVLRTRFERHPDGWRWLTDELADPADLQLQLAADLPHAQQLAQQAADTAFDLAAGPLARLLLIRVDDERSVLALVAEHLVSDGWSTQCLFGRLTEIYQEITVGTARSELDCESYIDHAKREQRLLDELDPADFTGLTERILPPLPVPTPGAIDHLNCRTEQLSYPLPALDKVARQRLGLFGASALAHSAAQSALAEAFAGGPPATLLTMATRYQPASRRAVGWYINKVPVPLPPAGAAGEPVRAFGGRLATALNNRRLPWTWLLATLRPDAFGRHASCPYVGFNAMADASRQHAREVTSWPASRLRKLPVDTGFWDAGLMISADRTETELLVTIEAKQDFVPADQLARLTADLDRRLRSWATQPAPRPRPEE